MEPEVSVQRLVLPPLFRCRRPLPSSCRPLCHVTPPSFISTPVTYQREVRSRPVESEWDVIADGRQRPPSITEPEQPAQGDQKRGSGGAPSPLSPAHPLPPELPAHQCCCSSRPITLLSGADTAGHATSLPGGSNPVCCQITDGLNNPEVTCDWRFFKRVGEFDRTPTSESDSSALPGAGRPLFFFVFFSPQ